MIISKINIVIGRLKFYLNKYIYLFVWLWGVEIGHKANFYGKVYFNRQKSSFISIGHNCTFRSSKTSNWIGIDRPCMISTQSGNPLDRRMDDGESATRDPAGRRNQGEVLTGALVRVSAHSLVVITSPRRSRISVSRVLCRSGSQIGRAHV